MPARAMALAMRSPSGVPSSRAGPPDAAAAVPGWAAFATAVVAMAVLRRRGASPPRGMAACRTFGFSSAEGPGMPASVAGAQDPAGAFDSEEVVAAACGAAASAGVALARLGAASTAGLATDASAAGAGGSAATASLGAASGALALEGFAVVGLAVVGLAVPGLAADGSAAALAASGATVEASFETSWDASALAGLAFAAFGFAVSTGSAPAAALADAASAVAGLPVSAFGLAEAAFGALDVTVPAASVSSDADGFADFAFEGVAPDAGVSEAVAVTVLPAPALPAPVLAASAVSGLAFAALAALAGGLAAPSAAPAAGADARAFAGAVWVDTATVLLDGFAEALGFEREVLAGTSSDLPIVSSVLSVMPAP
ncbi:hypothetical protein ASG51_01165 [Methylobacterium sp. Leaf465]|nr:hypothetical protein ASG51_01165 [Methylobacterium sp. Leaf465]